VIRQAAYGVDPWQLRESEFKPDLLAQSESIFTLSNGHFGLRGNLDEGDPHGLPGTYLNSVYEVRPLPYAEAGYGFPDDSQTVINVTNGKIIRLLVNDEPLDIRYGTLHSHERVLDLRAGTLTRTLDWSSPAGTRVKVTSVRMVSLTQRAIAAISYTVEPVEPADKPLRLVIQSELVANEELPKAGKDPRVAAVLEAPLVSEEHQIYDGANSRVILMHKTRVSNLRVAAAMWHEVDGPQRMVRGTESFPDLGRATIAALVEPGDKIRVVKYIAYGWSSQRSKPALTDQVVGALAAAQLSGWDRLLQEQREYLDEFWDGADVEVGGDAEIQQAVRFGLFHILQAGARAELRPIAAKGLTGTGYDGHTFWDTEMYVLPVLTYTQPQAAADALRWRLLTLPEAKQRAADLGLAGAAYPWRTIRGQECSGYWPAGTAAFHINADIAYAVTRYINATQDADFEKEVGVEILVETARLWRSLGQHDAHGKFRIDGVTGPDEYSAVKDNNIYTNLMAQHNLAAAADMVEKHFDHARGLGVTMEEAASWRDAAAAMYIPFDERLGVHPQHEGFTDYARWDFDNTPEDHYPLLLHYPYFQLYRKQVIKQADLVMAMQLHPDAFTDEQKARNFAYYEPITVRDSSLSACTQAVLAAEVGQLDLAYDYLAEAAFMDLADVEHNTADGVHMASLAGAWIALMAGFGGLRAHTDPLEFSPRLPNGITSLSFRLRFQGRKLRVAVTHADARYELVEGEPVPLVHHGRKFTLGTDHVTFPVPAITAGPRPAQPPGRLPYTHKDKQLFRTGRCSRHPVKYLPHQLHRCLGMEEREPCHRLAFPGGGRDEGDLVAQQLIRPLRVLRGVPAEPAEQHDAQLGLADELQLRPVPDLRRGLPGQVERGLDRRGVGLGSVYRQREPQRQAPSPPGEVIRVVGRVPLLWRVVDDVEVGGVLRVHRPGEPRVAVEQRGAVERGEQPLVRVHDERVGVLDAVVPVPDARREQAGAAVGAVHVEPEVVLSGDFGGTGQVVDDAGVRRARGRHDRRDG
jgi:alpha,alpha-trehalose phosphorylase